MGIAQLFCGRILPLAIVGAAIFLGWIRSSPTAWGVVFATLGPILDGGHVPPLLVGHGKMTGSTPEVPGDMTPMPRPAGEKSLSLVGDGRGMPMSGLGMCCRHSAYDDVLVRRTTLWYLLQGGRHIDTAHVYRNHKAIGLGIKDAIGRGVPRSEIFVTTKIFPSYYGYNSTLDVVPTFLEELGLNELDMVLMHAPKFPLVANECTKLGLADKDCRQETWKALSKLREDGLVRNLGVSNFGVDLMKEIQELGGRYAPISNNQIQFNAFVPEKQHAIYEYCQTNDVAVTAYYPVGGSFEKEKATESELIRELSAKYGKSTYQILLRWVVEKGAAVIPGTANPKHMLDNLDVFAWSIDEEDMEKMEKLRSSEEAGKMTYLDPEKMFG